VSANEDGAVRNVSAISDGCTRSVVIGRLELCGARRGGTAVIVIGIIGYRRLRARLRAARCLRAVHNSVIKPSMSPTIFG
jgi:hypothetical protein